jgi:hypothetical protein
VSACGKRTKRSENEKQKLNKPVATGEGEDKGEDEGEQEGGRSSKIARTAEGGEDDSTKRRAPGESEAWREDRYKPGGFRGGAGGKKADRGPGNSEFALKRIKHKVRLFVTSEGMMRFIIYE